MASVFPGGSGAVPRPEESGRLRVEFSRNPNSFAIARYARVIPISRSPGLYPRLDNANAFRVSNSTDFIWPDGDDAPRGDAAKTEWVSFVTERSSYPFEIGNKSINMSDISDIVAANSRQMAQRAMTDRAVKMIDQVTDSNNWASNQFDTAANIGGGIWAGSTVANDYIRSTFDEVRNQIVFATGGAIGPRDLMCVVDPKGVETIVQSPEYKQYLVNHAQAINAAQNTEPFDSYGLLPRLYGIEMVVEDTVRNTAREGGTDSTGYLLGGDGGTAFFVARPGDNVVGVEGATDFSTLSVLALEEFTVEEFSDPVNRRTAGRVVQDIKTEITAPAAGVVVTNITTAA